MSQLYTVERVDRDSSFRARQQRRYWGEILTETGKARARHRMHARREEIEAVIESDRRLGALGAWDRTVLTAVVMLGEYATEERIVGRVRREGHASASVEAVGRALRRLARQGLVAGVAIDVRGEAIRGYRFVPEGE